MLTNNCLTVSFTQLGGLAGEKERQGCRVTGTVNRSTSFSATFGLVCVVSVGELSGYQVLWVQDGMLLSVDGGNLFVKKQ